MNKFLKHLVFSSILVGSSCVLAVPVLTVSASSSLVEVQPGTTTPETFTVRNNMAEPLTVTNIEPLSGLSALEITIVSDNCTGQTLAVSAQCSISTNLITANISQAISGKFNLHACISNGAQCSAIPSTNEPTITINPSMTVISAIAGGRYQDPSTYFPMLATSVDNGATWTYSVEKGKNLPTDFASGGLFYSVNCNGSTCVAGGEYDDGGGSQYPMLATSTNGGVTWTYKIEKGVNLPTGYASNGLIARVNCNNTTCIAGGRYSDSGGIQYPMLAISFDSGSTWTYKIEKGMNLPNDYTNTTYVSSANCSGSICLASGRYDDSGGIQYPMLAISFDSGSTWTYKIEKGSNLPTNYADGGNITSANCSGSSCVVGGLYYIAGFAANYPMLATSLDGGVTWSYKVEENLNLPTDYFANSVAFFNSVHCSGSTCIAGGKYAANTVYPMLAVSTDGGATWVYKVEKDKNLPTDYRDSPNDGYFKSVNCSGSTCIAGGEYDDSNGISTPMLAISSDAGVTWNYKVEQNMNLPNGNTNFSSFEGVNCSGSTCIAGGFYNDAVNDTFPMLAVSSDSGLTWAYKIEKGMNLPTDFIDNGSFGSVSSANETFKAHGFCRKNPI